MRVQTVLALAWMAGCSSGPPPAVIEAAPKAPAAAGCARDLSGMWRHAADASYAWHLMDDKTTVAFHPMPGGDAHAGSDAHAHHKQARDGQARISLSRKGPALAGSAQSKSPTLDGSTECAVSFQAWAVRCSDTDLVLAMESSYSVDANCKREQTGGELDMVNHRLVRQEESRRIQIP